MAMATSFGFWDVIIRYSDSADRSVLAWEAFISLISGSGDFVLALGLTFPLSVEIQTWCHGAEYFPITARPEVILFIRL